jgi:dUTP pyrophosphatase
LTLQVAIKRLPHAPAELPEYASESAAGLDLRVATDSPVTINSGERKTIPTGFAIAIPEGFEGQIRMRSGVALEKGLLLPNAPATIDADYRGELKVIVANISPDMAQLQPGERFAQLIISPIAHIKWQEMTDLPASNRGDAGFGSTGHS